MVLLIRLRKIIIFYIIYYICLACFFTFLMFIAFQTIDAKVPKLKTENSVIGNNPGLGFRPEPPNIDMGSTLIWYEAGNKNNLNYWINALEQFLKDYKNNKNDRSKCDYGPSPPSNDKPCAFDVNNLEPCTSAHEFNYANGAPCVLLKINKIFGWIPQFYNDTKKLPNNMPNTLKAHIKQKEEENKQYLNTVWVNCYGQSPADKENIGTINYIPQQGFPGYYFPFLNNDSYLSPLVAVIFTNPKRNVIINVECTHWAQNIVQTPRQKMGILHFELLVD